MNLYPVLTQKGAPKASTNFYRTPGMVPYCILGAGPVRALFEEDGRCFGVASAGFYELFVNRTAVLRGAVAADARPASISSNGSGGNQILVTSAGHGYIFDLLTAVFTEITDPAFPRPCATALFFDGYFIALNAATGSFHLSTLLDGLTWNALDIGLESQVSDRTRMMARSHDNLWLLGSKHASPWYNSGASSFPFAPVGGTGIEHGIEAVWSIAGMDNTLFWLGRDAQGSGVVFRADGFTPRRISDHALEYRLAQLPRINDAIAYAYMEEGHLFYVLYLPADRTTHVYDVTTDLWHERAIWDEVLMRFHPHLSRCHCLAFGKHLVGDRASGVVYHMSMNYLQDYELVPTTIGIVGGLSGSIATAGGPFNTQPFNTGPFN